VSFVTLPTGSYPASHGIIGAGAIRDQHWNRVAMGDETNPENGHETLDRVAYGPRYEPEVLGSRKLAHFYKQELSRELLEQSMKIFRQHKPNLTIINLGSADYAAHSFGPDTPEYRETLSYQDGLIASLLAELDTLKIRDRTAILISADHGFSHVDGRNVVAPVLPKREPQVDTLSALNIEHMVTNTGGTSMGLYIRDKARVEEAAAAIRKQPWFEAMYCEDPKLECDKSLSDLRAYFPGRSPDLMVDIDDDATLNFPRSWNHGSLRLSDMRIPLVLSGAGIAKGARFGKASLVDVAPTVVKLLGLPGTVLKPDGRVLTEALAPSAP
jgi:arylsulfatase A-like enzyme